MFGFEKILKFGFATGLTLNAWLTRHRYLRFLETRVTTPIFIRITRLIRGTPKPKISGSPQDYGREWERLLGNNEYAKVIEVDPTSSTVIGEISGMCPLRGTGDVHACYRLMAYDRGLMEPLGARLVVLESQSEPGKTKCRLAIRPSALDDSDLIPAHMRFKAE